ncbi:hypothetical protein [Endozoicomonas sp. SCSIO W0465]|uniref:hypothetical protein n=1 Tax=Endozoicomonas sp. SCSIO W0465 TaxID=2918516 RepID=UPI0020760EC3|nr:hypothetical protein [Endozoicomonas sp. SCSIO W0465]USE38232.1 hypothetical protein MJO57_08740 [Endozoicomonas sp. SCSIO W0465]
MEPGRFSSSYRYTESTKITVQPRSSSKPAAARCAPRPKSSFGSFSVWGGDNGKESLSRPEKVTERQIDGGKVYTVAGLSKLGDRSIDIYVTQSGKVHHSSPGNRLVHYGTGDEIKELKPGEDRIERSEVDKEFYYLSKGQSKLLQRGKVYGAAGSIPDCYVSPQGKLIKAGTGARLFQIGAEKELIEYKPDSKGYQHIISKKKEHFIVTPKGAFPLKPGTVQPGAVNSPAVYLSENGELTVASDIRSRLFKLGAEDEAVEFNSSEAAFKYVVSKRQTPFLITSKGVCTLKPESFYRAQDGRPDMYISADCVLTRASDTTSRLVSSRPKTLQPMRAKA